MSSTEAPQLVWKYAGRPRRKTKRTHSDWEVCPCEACNDLTLNVWQRVGVPGVVFWRCWLHGPGQDGRECDNPPGSS